MLPILRIHQISDSRSLSNGDSTLLQYSDHGRQTNVLIDCGIKKSVTAQYLQALEIRNIDLLVVSHIDLDHIGGLREVLSKIDVKWLWVMNIDPLKRFVERAVGYDREKYHFMECFRAAQDSIVIAKQKRVRCSSVYESCREKIGPFLVEVLSPPLAFDDFLQNTGNVEKILKSPKGDTYRNLLKDKNRIKEDVSTEILPGREPNIQEIDGQEPSRYTDLPEYNEEAFDSNFDLASRGLLNNASIVIRVSCLAPNCPTSVFEPLSMLFPGDLEDWSYLFFRYNEYVNTPILKIPHHGSDGVQSENRNLYEFLRPRLSLVFPYPPRMLPSYRVIALLARSGLASCTSCRRGTNVDFESGCCHIDNKCTSLDSVVYEFTPLGLSLRNSRGLCTGIFRP